MKTINFGSLSEMVHKTAVEKGWYDKPRSDFESLTLVVSELSEAVEEIRKGTPLVYVDNCGQFEEINSLKDTPKGKPEGVMIEVADAAIRVLDFAGYKKIELDKIVQNLSTKDNFNYFLESEYKKLSTPLEYCGFLIIVASLLMGHGLGKDNDGMDADVPLFLLLCAHFCEVNGGYSLEDLIHFKHNYNTTRSYRHGGKLA